MSGLDPALPVTQFISNGVMAFTAIVCSFDIDIRIFLF